MCFLFRKMLDMYPQSLRIHFQTKAILGLEDESGTGLKIAKRGGTGGILFGALEIFHAAFRRSRSLANYVEEFALQAITDVNTRWKTGRNITSGSAEGRYFWKYIRPAIPSWSVCMKSSKASKSHIDNRSIFVEVFSMVPKDEKVGWMIFTCFSWSYFVQKFMKVVPGDRWKQHWDSG